MLFDWLYMEELINASEMGDVDMVKELIQSGIDVDIQNNKGKTFVFVLIRINNLVLFYILISLPYLHKIRKTALPLLCL